MFLLEKVQAESTHGFRGRLRFWSVSCCCFRVSGNRAFNPSIFPHLQHVAGFADCAEPGARPLDRAPVEQRAFRPYAGMAVPILRSGRRPKDRGGRGGTDLFVGRNAADLPRPAQELVVSAAFRRGSLLWLYFPGRFLQFLSWDGNLLLVPGIFLVW